SILAGPQSPSVNELQDLGVSRVSYGSGFLKAAISGAKNLAREILEKGTFNLLKDGVQTTEITGLVGRRKQSTSLIRGDSSSRCTSRRPAPLRFKSAIESKQWLDVDLKATAILPVSAPTPVIPAAVVM